MSRQAGGEAINQSEMSVSESKPELLIEQSITIPDGDQQERVPLRKPQQPLKPAKHQKRYCLLIVMLFVVIYFVSTQLLATTGEATPSLYQEAAIDFNITLGKNYTWIQQRLDHFGQDTRTWMQRLLLDFDPMQMKQSTPIFISLSNLAPVKDTLNFVNLRSICKKLRCAQLAMEPRYFGESRPLGANSYSTSNLQYLTINQMVEDIAYAINRITTLRLFNITKNNPWIVCGESHSAIVALLFRSKYPELTVGAYASSPLQRSPLAPGVSQRLYTMVISGGKRCRSVVQTIMQDVQGMALGEQKEGFLLEIGKGTRLLPEQALYLFMQRLRMLDREIFIHYCSSPQQEKVVAVFKDALLYTDDKKHDPLTYSAKELSLPEQWHYFEILRSRRAYEWLRCSQLGLFESYNHSDKRQFNFPQLNQSYFRGYCEKIFSTGVWPQEGAFVEEGLRGLTKAIIVHGYYDLWLPYALRLENQSSVGVHTVKCPECIHNFDAELDGIAYQEVQEVRGTELKLMSAWIAMDG